MKFLKTHVIDNSVIRRRKNTLNSINEKKELLERFYSITSDLGYISKTLSEKGIKEIKNIKIQPTRSIRVMTAQRYHDPKNILEQAKIL